MRILWSALGGSEVEVEQLRDVTGTGARLTPHRLLVPGQEIRFDLLEDDGTKVASGLGKVVRTGADRGAEIEFRALGLDPAVAARLDGARARQRPPPLPPKGEAKHDETDAAAVVEPLAVKKPAVVIGIDLGTTYTCASYVADGRPRIVPSRTGTNTIPSMITFDADGRWHVGQRAADRQILNPLRTVYGSKRLVGRTYRAELAEELQTHFAYVLAEAEGRRFGARIDERVVSMETIAARILDEVRSTAEAHLGKPVDAAVITVPAYFTDVQRDAVRRAAREANLTVHRIVNEPTAAAVAYGHKRKGLRARVAVWDFGGGTFDFSLVDVSDGKLEVIATGGDNFLGGGDFDDLLASVILAEFQRVSGCELEPDAQQIARLREAAESAKRALSSESEHTVRLPEFTPDPKRDLVVEVTRAQFETITSALVERSIAIAREVLREAGISPEDVDDVLLVGGTTRVPAVQQAVHDLFGRRPSKGINADEAVALGAALLASDGDGEDGPMLLDVLPMTIGFGAPGLRFNPIAPKNTRLPFEREVAVPADLLGTVTFPLFQGESPDVSEDEYLCTVIVEDRSLWDGGRVKLRVAFDEHCVMSIEARDARTGRALDARLDRTRAVDDVLREMGRYEGPTHEARWMPPPSRIGALLGRLFKFGSGRGPAR